MKKKHVTVPRFHNPGKGRPMETLAYLSPIEHEMIRQMTDGTWERGPKGIRSYADDSASSNGVSRGDNAGTKGSGGTGQGGQGSGGNAGGSKASGSPNSGTSTGGTSASKSNSSSSQSSTSSTTGAGGQRGAGSNYGPGSARPGAPSTALGQASQAAQSNAARASGTSTQWGGSQYGPGQMYSSPSRSASALNSVVNGTRLAGLNTRQTIDAMQRNMGLSNPIGRAGMVGTFDHESAGLNPNNNLGDKGTAYGLAQWRGDRQTALGKYASDMGIPRNDAALQTAFSLSEMGRSFPKTLAGLQNASSIAGAVAAMNDYEKPQGWTRGGDPTKVAGWNDRVARSQTAFGNTAGPTVVASASPTMAGARSATAAEEAVRRDFVNSQIGSLVNDPVINRGLIGGLGNAMWNTRVADATRVAQGQKPRGAYGEVTPATDLAGFRTLEQQDSISGKFSKVKSPDRSYHTWGMAADVTPPRQPGETQRQYDLRVGEVNREIAANMDDPNVKWGGTVFGKFVDPAHFQYGKGPAPETAPGMGSYVTAAGTRPGSTPASGTQVAGIANAGLSQAETQARARAAASGAAAVSQGFGSGPVQGPQRYSGPLDSIPAPKSMGMMAPPSAFAQDPRLSVPQGAYPAQARSQIATDPRVAQTPVGGYPAARAQSQVATDPRVSQTPSGAFPAAPKPASVFAEDPRIASPLGAYPAAPKKDVQLAWNVPPMGGAMSASPEAWAGFGQFGSNRPLPQGPAAIQGTIHSKTAEAAPSTSWMDGLKKQAEGMGLDPDKIITVGTDAVQKLSEGNKKVAEAQQSPLGRLGLALMGAFGGGAGPRSGGLLGNPQDRSDRYFAPPQMPQAMPQQQMAQAPAQDQITQLLQMQQQMIAEGADPEELAALQALIDQLSIQEA